MTAVLPVVVADLARHRNVEINMTEPILTETTRGLVRRLRHERRRARSESGRRQQQATQSMALVRSFASAVGVRIPNYLSTFGPKPHEYDACRAAALRLRADLIDARAQVAAVRALCDREDREMEMVAEFYRTNGGIRPESLARPHRAAIDSDAIRAALASSSVPSRGTP